MQNNENSDSLGDEVDYDFRRMQEESRRIAESGNWNEAYRQFDEGIRTRLSNVLRKELETRANRDSNAYGLLNNTSNFKIYSNVDGQTFRDMFEIVKTFDKMSSLSIYIMQVL